MTELQKERVARMRRNGFSYGQIARNLRISINSVKSYCQRNQLGGLRATDEASASSEYRSCPQCDTELPLNKSHHIKRFCSDVCRMAWWREHPEQLRRKAYYQFTCHTCQKSFESYGNSKRKFCSHSCYIFSRFHGGSDE